VPLFVGDREDLVARTMAGAVHQYVDPAPRGHHLIDQALEIVVRLVRAGNADAVELLGKRFALAGG
jgi:hypothetical protein